MAVIPSLQAIAFDASGNLATAARMYVFVAGTTTPVDVFTTSAMSVAHSHPIDANSAGVFPPVYAAQGSYKVRYTTSAAAGGATLYEVDNYQVAASGSTLDFPVSVETANFTVTADDRGKVFLCDASAIGGLVLTITADSETLTSGFPFFIVNTAATGTITLQGTGAQLIDGSATKSLATQYSSLGVVSTGASGWQSVMTANASLGSAAALNVSTAAEFRNDTAAKVLTGEIVWDAAEEVTLTDAATIAVDMSTFLNAKVTLGGNRTLGQPSNTKVGQTGAIRIIQDGTGSRTLAYHADWKFAGGVDPPLTTTASATDILYYQVIATNFIAASLSKAFA
jgi:hypothetical protein